MATLVSRLPRPRGQAGFTIIEVMVAAMVTLVAFMAVASIFDTSRRTAVATDARTVGTNMARELVEASRGIPYAEITDANIPARLAGADPDLADDEPGIPYTVTRRGITYTITSDTCIMDDGRDGGGAPPRSGDFCPESVAAGTLDGGRTDRIPEDYKRIDVTATWEVRGRASRVRQTTLVNNPGSAGAPAVISLTAQGVGNPPVVGPTHDNTITPHPTSGITFDVITSSQPHTLVWLLDGVAQQTICSPCSGSQFQFTWNLNSPHVAPDGPYLVSAEAFDDKSVSGPTRSTTIVLNRRFPRAPSGVAGGRNNGVVEIEWFPNPERDLTGYTVSREKLDGTRDIICTLQLDTRCVDRSPPDFDRVKYRVRPHDVEMDGRTPRRSLYATQIEVLRFNNPPFGVTDAKKLVNLNGSVTLAWNKPSPEDPDAAAGDGIAFYRIYRDGTAVSNRYSRVDATGVTSHTFIDGDAGGDRRYWIVPVDRNYAEGPFVEAVP